MEIFGFSAAKIIVILIIAIIVFGPDKVPEMAKTVGRTIRNVRRYMNEMTKEFNDATGGLREEFAGIAQDIKGELAATQADLRSQLDLTGIFAEATATEIESNAAPAIRSSTDSATAIATPPSAADRDEASPTVLACGTPPVIAAMQESVVPRNGNSPVRHATKADPFADLIMSAASGMGSRSAPSRSGYDGAAVRTTEAAGSTLIGTPLATQRHLIGRSVTGSAYLRRRVSTIAPHRGLCRSARIRDGANACGLTASHATTSALVAAP